MDSNTGVVFNKRIPMYKIYDAVKDHTGITKILLQKKIQTKYIAVVRSATYLLFRHFGYTVEEIGKSIRRDHSTVSYGSNNICMSGLKLFTELRDIINESM